MKISVLGCGRWGTFIAWYAHHIGYDVLIWGRENSPHYQELEKTRKNEYLTLSPDIYLTHNLKTALTKSDICVISINSQQLRSFGKQISSLNIKSKVPFILCMKGLEIGSGKRLTTVLSEEIGIASPIAVWVGPGHVQDFLCGMPNCMIMSSLDTTLTKYLAHAFSSPLIRFYYGKDLLGIEIGAAAKNVLGLAAGMLDGIGYSSLKGALMARGTHELSRLIEAMGGNPMTVYGLSHLGDYEATLFSEHSNNRRFGEDLILGKPFHKLAEGVYTVQALMDLSETYHVELPISKTVYEIIYNHTNPRKELEKLFLRSVKSE